MAPEVWERKTHDYKADLWSLGVILYFMMYRELPFTSSKNKLKEMYVSCNPYFDVCMHLRDISKSSQIS